MEINFLAAGLSALAAFFLGFMWYTVIFAKPWQKLIGMGPKGKGVASTKQTPSLGKLLVVSFILQLIMATNMAAFIGKDADWLFGLFAGLAVGLGWVSLSFGVSYLFEGRPLKLWLINAGYYTTLFAITGVIIGAF